MTAAPPDGLDASIQSDKTRNRGQVAWVSHCSCRSHAGVAMNHPGAVSAWAGPGATRTIARNSTEENTSELQTTTYLVWCLRLAEYPAHGPRRARTRHRGRLS